MKVALIPARGGSKRIPHKNIRAFCGKPIIAYSIRCAFESGIFDRIIVSTDSQTIANIAKEYGAEVPFLRPENISNDYASTDDVIMHALDFINTQHRRYPDFMCCIYPTAPFIKSKDLLKAFEIMIDKKATTVLPVTTFEYNIFRALKINHEGKLEMFYPENRNKRSQDLPEVFHDAGQFYWINVEKYLQEKKLFSENSYPLILPRNQVQDIDTEEDWQRAEQIFRYREKK